MIVYDVKEQEIDVRELNEWMYVKYFEGCLGQGNHNTKFSYYHYINIYNL